MTAIVRGTSVLLLALVAGGLNATVIGVPRGEFRASYQLAPNGRVAIHNLYGDVQITAWDRDEVLVVATKHSTDAGRLNDAQIIVDTSSGMVSIRTQYTGGDAGHPASVEYRIMVPRGANLENVKLVNGGLSLSGMTGPVKASSVNGSIKAERMEGQVDLSTVNGFLDAGFERISKCNPISLSSVNGPIKVSLPSGAGAHVSAHNRSGGIDADFGRAWRAPGGHRLEAAVNGGGTQVRVHNVNGGISIHSNWNRRSVHPIS
ncbi:MAG: DUF4097 family beta strand repeat-containing protein [Candidatus Solibacter sp.]|nr:DUF4097 family beta strand repeat-containing protein [Candidatus Solibacter sp.]